MFLLPPRPKGPGLVKKQNSYHSVMLNGCEASPINKNKREILRAAQDDRAK